MVVPIDSTYAILDVKKERVKLARRVEAGERIPITIHGFIESQSSRDDGTSIEFGIEVTSVEEQ